MDAVRCSSFHAELRELDNDGCTPLEAAATATPGTPSGAGGVALRPPPPSARCVARRAERTTGRDRVVCMGGRVRAAAPELTTMESTKPGPWLAMMQIASTASGTYYPVITS